MTSVVASHGPAGTTRHTQGRVAERGRAHGEMMAAYTDAELEVLVSDLESDLVERKESASDGREDPAEHLRVRE